MEKMTKVKKGDIVKFMESDDICEVTYIRQSTPDDELKGTILGVVNSKRNCTFCGYRGDQPIPMFGEVTIKHVIPMTCRYCKEGWKCFGLSVLFRKNKPACKDFLCNWKKLDKDRI